ncbi:MAG TPA: YjjG family noncanonical pyrimidine nucleotidase [Anaerolineales bacterium]|nr:YjjG family noncanonical pyrimidine nucleotidase [Anaerolineales bacterium]
MKKHYPWLFFDADGTLFDYHRAEATAFRKAFELMQIQFEEGYLDVYQRINSELWKALERHEITPAVLRLRRFEQLLEALQLTGSADELNLAYVEQLGLCTDLIDGAYEVVQTLSRTSRIAIVTNGLESVQRSRLMRSTIHPFVTELIISEEVGAAKPQAAFFDVAFAETGNPSKEGVLIIGDSLSSDIQGGVNYGIDTCWYNPGGESKPESLSITYEITRLQNLLAIVE